MIEGPPKPKQQKMDTEVDEEFLNQLEIKHASLIFARQNKQ